MRTEAEIVSGDRGTEFKKHWRSLNRGNWRGRESISFVIDVVVDTNVLVAAFRSSLGASFRLLQTLERSQWRPVISPALALEYEAVLKRGVGGLGLNLVDIDDFVEYLCSRCSARADLFSLAADVAGPRR